MYGRIGTLVDIGETFCNGQDQGTYLRLITLSGYRLHMRVIDIVQAISFSLIGGYKKTQVQLFN